MLVFPPIEISPGRRRPMRTAGPQRSHDDRQPGGYSDQLVGLYQTLAAHPLRREPDREAPRSTPARTVEIQPPTLPADAVAVSILACSGGACPTKHGPPVVTDLASLTWPMPLPILSEHSEPIGRCTFVSTADGAVFVKGFIFTRYPAAVRIVDRARDGFKWQASTQVNAMAGRVDAACGAFMLRGRPTNGPYRLAIGARLIEVSIVLRGADPNTLVRVG